MKQNLKKLLCLLLALTMLFTLLPTVCAVEGANTEEPGGKSPAKRSPRWTSSATPAISSPWMKRSRKG